MKSDLERAGDLLLSEGYTCVLVCGDESVTSKQRGVAPLISFIDSKKDFSLFSAADRVVGRGAALLYALMKIKALHAEIISEKAAEVLDSNGIPYTYSQTVPHIINRKGDGMCPMEKATLLIDSPSEGYKAIVDTLKALN